MTRHDEKTVELALGCIVACAGSTTDARKLLLAKDVDIADSTLRNWRDNVHAERYAELASEHGKTLEEAIVREIRELAARATVVQRKALELAEERIDDKKVTAPEAARMAKDLAHVTGQNVDKLLTLTGRPTEIVEERTVAEIAAGPILSKVLKRVPNLDEQPQLEGAET